MLAVDVGGTTIKISAVDDAGHALGTQRIPTPRGADAAERIIMLLADQVVRTRLERPDIELRAVGIGVAGLVDERRGRGVSTSNLDWSDFPFRDRAQDVLGLPVAFGHDVRTAGRAEHELGALRGFENAMLVVVGTGVASAVLVNGKFLVSHGFAGEIGHSIVLPDGPRCACGGRGHLESLASASAIARAYDERGTGRTVKGSREVHELALAGDTAAREVWATAIDHLALGIAQAISLFAPDAVVIGGGLSHAGTHLFEPLHAELERILTFQRRPRLLRASLGAEAGMLGAALNARDIVAEGGAPGPGHAMMSPVEPHAAPTDRRRELHA